MILWPVFGKNWTGLWMYWLILRITPTNGSPKYGRKSLPPCVCTALLRMAGMLPMYGQLPIIVRRSMYWEFLIYVIAFSLFVNWSSSRRNTACKELDAALKNNWVDKEVMRQEFLNQPKFGNDIDAVDDFTVEVCTLIRSMLEEKHNIKRIPFPSVVVPVHGTRMQALCWGRPDGRKAEEPLAHGMNPMHGRNKGGILPTMRSFTKLNYAEYQGGSFQIELHPSFFPRRANREESL